MRKVLIARMGWMKFYNGSQSGDEKPVGGGSNNEEYTGVEITNFRRYSDTLYGSLTFGGGGSELRLDRIDPNATSDTLKNVLIIFIARDPREGSNGQVVVGWYKNATVYRYPKHKPKWHASQTHVKNAVLLPTAKRDWIIKRGKNTPGQSNIFFTHDNDGKAKKLRWLDEILYNIDNYQGANIFRTPDAESDAMIESERDNVLATSMGQGVVVDSSWRKVIENKAMKAAISYYEREGYIVTNVSAYRSYDLCCRKDGKELLVEVKGSQAPLSSITLTPNEVKLARQKKNFALFVLHSIRVTERRPNVTARGGIPHIIFPWNADSKYLKPIAYSFDLCAAHFNGTGGGLGTKIPSVKDNAIDLS